MRARPRVPGSTHSHESFECRYVIETHLPSSFINSLPALDRDEHVVVNELSNVVDAIKFPYPFSTAHVVATLKRIFATRTIGQVRKLIIEARDCKGDGVRMLGERYEAAIGAERVTVVHGGRRRHLKTTGYIVQAPDDNSVTLAAAYLYVDFVKVHSSYVQTGLEVLKRIVGALFLESSAWGAGYSRVLSNLERAARDPESGEIVLFAHVGTTTNIDERRAAKIKTDETLRERVMRAFIVMMPPESTAFELVVIARIVDLPIYSAPALSEACEVALQILCNLSIDEGKGGTGQIYGSEREFGSLRYLTDGELGELLDDRRAKGLMASA